MNAQTRLIDIGEGAAWTTEEYFRGYNRVATNRVTAELVV